MEGVRLSCGSARVFPFIPFEREVGVVSSIWRLAVGLSESVRGQPLATTGNKHQGVCLQKHTLESNHGTPAY